MLALWSRDDGVGSSPFYSPYLASASIAVGAQAVNRSSSESKDRCLLFRLWTHFSADGM